MLGPIQYPLKEGEKVIVEGTQKVRPGMVVTAKRYQGRRRFERHEFGNPDGWVGIIELYGKCFVKVV